MCRHAEGLVLSSYLLLLAIFILFEEGLLP
jgi:hypothetical protein